MLEQSCSLMMFHFCPMAVCFDGRRDVMWSLTWSSSIIAFTSQKKYIFNSPVFAYCISSERSTETGAGVLSKTTTFAIVTLFLQISEVICIWNQYCCFSTTGTSLNALKFLDCVSIGTENLTWQEKALSVLLSRCSWDGRKQPHFFLIPLPLTHTAVVKSISVNRSTFEFACREMRKKFHITLHW